MMKIKILSGLVMGLLVMASGFSGTVWAYEITILGDDIFPKSISDSGQITGQSNGAAFAYSSGVVTYFNFGQPGYTSANSINSSGYIVGRQGQNSYIASYDGSTVAYMTSPAAGTGTSINSYGHVAGGGINGRAWLWRPYPQGGSLTDLGDGYALDVNDLDQVVGMSTHHAVLYSNGLMIGVGITGEYTSQANAINNRGDIVGASSDYYNSASAFLWHNGEPIIIASGAAAYDINNYGQVIGNFQGGDPFIYIDGKTTNLKNLLPSSWNNTHLTGINDHGQIVGYTHVHDHSRLQGFLLTPDSIVVPIPGTIWLLGSGLAGLIGLIRVRRNPL